MFYSINFVILKYIFIFYFFFAEKQQRIDEMDRFQREFGSQFGEQGGFGSQIEHDNAIVGQNDGVADIPVEGGDEVCIIFFFFAVLK